jgi:hypothetical protein
MRVRRDLRILILRVIGVVAVVLAIGTIAVLAKPEWREYFAEIAVVLGALIICRAVAAGLRGRFRAEESSPFEWALRRERSLQKAPSQLVTAIAMASLPDRSTFELLAAAVDRRLNERYGYGLTDERARDVLGSDVYGMLLAPRSSGPVALLPRRKRGFVARYLPAVARMLPATGASRTGRQVGAPVNQRNESVQHVRTILTSLEKL